MRTISLLFNILTLSKTNRFKKSFIVASAIVTRSLNVLIFFNILTLSTTNRFKKSFIVASAIVTRSLNVLILVASFVIQ